LELVTRPKYLKSRRNLIAQSYFNYKSWHALDAGWLFYLTTGRAYKNIPMIATTKRQHLDRPNIIH
jgi:hypothetical protein